MRQTDASYYIFLNVLMYYSITVFYTYYSKNIFNHRETTTLITMT